MEYGLQKKPYQGYVFLLIQTIFFIIYHPYPFANNEIQAVFYWLGYLLFALVLEHDSTHEPYNLVIFCMLTNISPELCCCGNAKGSLM